MAGELVAADQREVVGAARPQHPGYVRAADPAGGDADECFPGRGLRYGNLLDADVARGVQQGGSHGLRHVRIAFSDGAGHTVGSGPLCGVRCHSLPARAKVVAPVYVAALARSISPVPASTVAATFLPDWTSSAVLTAVAPREIGSLSAVAR